MPRLIPQRNELNNVWQSLEIHCNPSAIEEWLLSPTTHLLCSVDVQWQQFPQELSVLLKSPAMPPRTHPGLMWHSWAHKLPILAGLWQQCPFHAVWPHSPRQITQSQLRRMVPAASGTISLSPLTALGVQQWRGSPETLSKCFWPLQASKYSILCGGVNQLRDLSHLILKGLAANLWATSILQPSL